jgi:hypothetical protein
MLPASHYVAAVSSIDVCLHEINARLLGGAFEVEYFVLPSENGGFLGLNWVRVRKFAATAATVLAIIESESFRSIVEVATGYYPSYREIIQDGAQFLKNVVVGVMCKENDDLLHAIPPHVNLDKVLKSKSNFYMACLRNEVVAGVGFEQTHDFPVKRSAFPRHIISKDLIRPAKSEFHIVEAIIVSPVTTKRKISWVLQDKHSREIIRARMMDDIFNKRLLDGRNPIKNSNLDDEMTAVIEHKMIEKNGDIEVKEKIIR